MENSMFNAKKHRKTSQVAPYEKYLREENIGPTDNDGHKITEKAVEQDRKGDIEKITEKQMIDGNEHKVADTEKNKEDAQVIEKVLNTAKSYVTHRSDNTWLSVPPMSALVEKLRQNRASELKVDKESHWSHSYDEKGQFGQLPKWKKNTGQHDKIDLNNDPRRFESIKSLPTETDQSSNEANKSKSDAIKPLIGDITRSDVHHLADSIKTGAAIDFDTAMVAILREADKDKRELTKIEQKTISDLKIARTNHLMKK